MTLGATAWPSLPGELEQLLADLQRLVDMGLVVEEHAAGEPPRYGLTALGEEVAADETTTAAPTGDRCPAT